MPVIETDETLRSILRCPDCRSALRDERGMLCCPSCEQDFPIHNGILDLLGKSAAVNHNEVATQDHVSDFYEEQRYQLPHSRAFHEQSVLGMANLVRLEGLVLDNGCGNGFLADVCRTLVPENRLVGLDISSGMLDKARKHIPHLVRGDSTRLPFAENSFNTVFARSLLHHLPEPETGVREIARVLKPGGEVVVLDTHKTLISTIPRAVANRGEHFDEDHKNFRTQELVSLLDKHLVVDRVEYMGYVAYPLLGFPDLYDFSKILPLGILATPLLSLDRMLANTPGLRKLGWGIIIKAHRAA